MTEADLQRQIIDYLVWQGCLVHRVNSGAVKVKDKRKGQRYFTFIRWLVLGQPATSKGVADIIGSTPDGRFFAFEVKRPGKLGKVSEAQSQYLAAVSDAGGIAMAVDSLESVQAIFNSSEGE